MGIQSNYLTVGSEHNKTMKTKSSKSRLKTVDSKGKLVSIKEGRNNAQEVLANYGINNDTQEFPSSGKKRKSVTKKHGKPKQSPKPKIGQEFTQRMYPNNRSKEFQNKIKFHPLSKDPSAAVIRKSMNF